MNSFDLPELVGRRCAAVSRFVHQFTGEPATSTGPLELIWDDGQVTVLDVRSDWTLDVSSDPWVDPYLEATPPEREHLGREVGLWSRILIDESADDLSAVVGARVTAAEPWHNEIGELAGADITFDTARITLRQWAGDLVVVTSRKP
ncbi:hypothetical protein [Myceligenerans indicum]|uniref:Uncharacterized protein n=1 Tax=Myceligenerans indicum TaxID=2593663 RepID=A0ABS1LLC8_9MICO|nr:hypothetical protein [Myceligenerans indicum]MBL0886367.1 hypothetical protein [Myceligenerans indicum]